MKRKKTIRVMGGGLLTSKGEAEKNLLTLLGAALSAALLLGTVGVSTATAYQDRTLEWVPDIIWSEVSPDPCYGNPGGIVVWKECESTASWPQFHKWTTGKATNELNTLGLISVGVTVGETEYAWNTYARTRGKFGAVAYTEALPPDHWPDMGVIAWSPEECLESHGQYNCQWESAIGYWRAGN